MSVLTNKEFYHRQIACLVAEDLDGLMNQYQDDAVLVHFDRTVRGKTELRDFFAAYIKAVSPFKLVSTDRYAETEDSIFIEATILAAGKTVRVYDVFVLRDGQIARHFTGTFPL